MKKIRMTRATSDGWKAGDVFYTSDEAAESYVEQGIAEFVDEKDVKKVDYPFNETDVRRFYRWLGHKSDEFTEIRAIKWVKKGKGSSSSFFVTDEDSFVQICREWNGKRNVYAGINPRKRKKGKAEDVARVTGIPFDVDPPAPDREAATDAEKKVARERKDRLVEWIKRQGYGEPYVDDSGNGFRVAIRINIPFKNHETMNAQLHFFFEEVHAVFPFLENISDLPRIIKVPGTWSLKGNNTPERPHRQARILQLGDATPNENVMQHILNITVPEKESEKPQVNGKKVSIQFEERKIKRLRPCYRKFLREGGRLSQKADRAAETGLRFSLVQELHRAGFSRGEILEACKKFADYDSGKSESEVDRELDNIRADGVHPWSCEAIHNNGGCLGPECVYYMKRIKGLKEARTAAVDVGEIFTYTGDRPYLGSVQVVALGFPQSRFMKLTFFCSKAGEDCPNCELMTPLHMDFEAADMDPSAFATYFDTGKGRDGLKVLIERGVKPGCSAWWKHIFCKGEDERAVTQAVVMDRQGTEGRAWFVHGPRCDLKRAPNWIIAEGWLCRGQRGRIGVLIKAFTMESEVAAPKLEDVEEARRVLRAAFKGENEELRDSTVWKLAETLQRRSQLKGKEIVKGYVSDVLTVASPVWVKTPEGPPQLGMTTNEMGPTTTAKSLRVRLLRIWLESGRYDTGRKTQAGLTAGAEKVEGIGWIIRKGLLPSMDLSWIVIDNMPPHSIDSQIESRRDGVVTITAIRSAELWARCRLKLLSNPTQPFDEHLFKCTALKVYDPKLIARFTFALFTYGASAEERYNKDIVKPQRGDAKLLDAARTVLKWNLSREVTFTVPADLWPTIMKQGKKLEKIYGCEDVPLLLRANPYKLSVLAYAFALLEGYVTPENRHVQLAYKWLSFCAGDIELDKYVEWWKSQHELSDREYEASKKKITSEMDADTKLHGGSIKESYTFKLIEYLVKNEKGQRDEIAAYLNVDAKTVSRKANVLKGLGLLRSDKDGYHFTAKGVRFFKRWFKESHVPHVPDVPPSEGQTHSEGEKTPRKASLTPESGDMRGIGDMEPIMIAVKTWCTAHRNERSEISLIELTEFIKKELKQKPKRVIEEAFKQAILMSSPKLGKAVVV